MLTLSLQHPDLICNSFVSGIILARKCPQFEQYLEKCTMCNLSKSSESKDGNNLAKNYRDLLFNLSIKYDRQSCFNYEKRIDIVIARSYCLYFPSGYCQKLMKVSFSLMCCMRN